MGDDTKDDFAVQLMNDIDPRLLELIRTKVNSFIKWDIVRFFHENPHTTDTAENIARYTGRDAFIIEPELQALAKAGVIEATSLNDLMVYTYSNSPELRYLVDAFLVACEDRQFRVKALYHVIRGMNK
jgi:hypothetical protein